MKQSYSHVRYNALHDDLLEAIDTKNIPLCISLLHKGAPPNITKGTTYSNESALLKAALSNKEELVDLIWVAGGEFSPYERDLLDRIPQALQKREDRSILLTKDHHAISFNARLKEANTGFLRVKDLASGAVQASPESLFENHHITFDRDLFTSELEKFPLRERFPDHITADQVVVGRVHSPIHKSSEK